MTNREKMNTLFDLYSKGLIDDVALADAIKALNGPTKETLVNPYNEQEYTDEQAAIVSAEREKAAATRERLAKYEKESYLNEQTRLNDTDLKEKIEFLKTVTNNNGEAIYLDLEENYNDLVARQEADPNAKEINDDYWKLVNEVNELYETFNKPKQEPAPEPVVVSGEENNMEPSVGVQEPVIPEPQQEEIQQPDETITQEPDLSAVQQDSDFQRATVQFAQTQQPEAQTEEPEVQTQQPEAQAEEPDISTVQQENGFQRAAAQAQSMTSGATTSTTANSADSSTTEYNYNNTPEPRKKVKAISRAGEALKNIMTNHKKGALLALGAIGAVVLIATVPAAGLIAAGAAGGAVVHEFNKGRKAK